MPNRPCRECGHSESVHTITSGPNSIGQFFHHLCAEGGASVPPYFLTKCRCNGYKPLHRLQSWWRTMTKETTDE